MDSGAQVSNLNKLQVDEWMQGKTELEIQINEHGRAGGSTQQRTFAIGC